MILFIFQLEGVKGAARLVPNPMNKPLTTGDDNGGATEDTGSGE